MRVAKRYIPFVGVETPMTPELYETFLRKKDCILAHGDRLHQPGGAASQPQQPRQLLGREPLPVPPGIRIAVWSRELTLKLMKQADEEGWAPVVHDCSNHTKFARDLNLRAKESGWIRGQQLWLRV